MVYDDNEERRVSASANVVWPSPDVFRVKETAVNAAGVVEAIREALGSRGQVSNIGAKGDQAVQFELTTTTEGIARVFEISVEEHG